MAGKKRVACYLIQTGRNTAAPKIVDVAPLRQGLMAVKFMIHIILPISPIRKGSLISEISNYHSVMDDLLDKIFISNKILMGMTIFLHELNIEGHCQGIFSMRLAFLAYTFSSTSRGSARLWVCTGKEIIGLSKYRVSVPLK